ncbi:MAG: hypothetical protein DME76_07695 [Verrucomicrobia bacterium]|nr:MAG: hypothetical protein DME76_07695 [Verrucomicrobiota bacterium]
MVEFLIIRKEFRLIQWFENKTGSTARPRHGERAVVAPYLRRTRATQIHFSNQKLNKSRVSEVERLVNLF